MRNGYRFYAGLSVWFAILIPVEIILCHKMQIGGFAHSFDGWVASVFVWSVLGLCASPFPRLREIPWLMLASVMIWRVLSLLPVLATRAVASTALADRRLASLDAAVGFDTGNLVNLVHRHPALDTMSAVIYTPMLLSAVSAALIIPPLLLRAEATRRYVFAVIVGVTLTTLLYVVAPAIGPWTVESFAPSKVQHDLADYILRIRLPGPVVVDPAVTGIISFPSFHCTFAVLTAYALGSSARSLRWPAWILSGLVCVSTLTTGWHYGVDVAGGILVAVVSLMVTGSFGWLGQPSSEFRWRLDPAGGADSTLSSLPSQESYQLARPAPLAFAPQRAASQQKPCVRSQAADGGRP